MDALNKDLEMPSVIEGYISDSAKEEIPAEYLLKLANFLADVNEDEFVPSLEDAHTTIEVALEADLNDIPADEEPWKELWDKFI